MCDEVYLSVGSFGSMRWNFRRLPPRFLRRSSGFEDDAVLGNDSMAQLFFLLFINDSGIWHYSENKKRKRIESERWRDKEVKQKSRTKEKKSICGLFWIREKVEPMNKGQNNLHPIQKFEVRSFPQGSATACDDVFVYFSIVCNLMLLFEGLSPFSVPANVLLYSQATAAVCLVDHNGLCNQLGNHHVVVALLQIQLYAIQL